jgi:hypothetical protein
VSESLEEGVNPTIRDQVAPVKSDLHNHHDFFVDIVHDLSYIRVASKILSRWDDQLLTLRHSPLVYNANTAALGLR